MSQKKQSQMNLNASKGGKTVTEVNDSQSMTYSNFQQKELVSMRESSFKNIISTNNENELSERISYLKTIVDKVPKLNLEVTIKLI